jgi:hypothetical protein
VPFVTRDNARLTLSLLALTVQHFTGRNTSRIAGGAMGNGANFRFEFRLR